MITRTKLLGRQIAGDAAHLASVAKEDGGREHVDGPLEGELARLGRLEVEKVHGDLARAGGGLVGGAHVRSEEAAVEAAWRLDDDESHAWPGLSPSVGLLRRVPELGRGEGEKDGKGEAEMAQHAIPGGTGDEVSGGSGQP